MRAVAHGWKKPGGGPSKAVAKEFMEEDMERQKMSAAALRRHERSEKE
jgi:hypothetical protein